jgi:hypothetical protein
MERAASQQLTAVLGYYEIANAFGELEFVPRQHDALGGITVHKTEDRRYIPHPGLSD